MEKARRPVWWNSNNDDGEMHRHANGAEGGSCEDYRMETDIEGEKAIFDYNGILLVGSAVVSR